MDIDNTRDDRLRDTDALHVGGPPADSQATLCIYADDLDPAAVTNLVKCLPTKARRKGDRDADRPRIRPAPIGQWFLEAPDELTLVDKIEFLLNATTDFEEDWRTLADSHSLELRAAVFLRSWTEGFELSYDTLARLSRRKWSLSISMYSAEGDDIIDAFLGRSQAGENASEL